jgi:CDP-glycerol glycerophosphotransferase (TagB/SpsB family)
MHGVVRVVVSSELEAEHFMQLAGFQSDELIISGLPKFDSSFKNPDADKILIMPTWRFWEFNTIKYNPEDAGYVKMIRRIIAAVPADLREKVVVVPHPLFSKQVFDSNHENEQISYDKLLRETKLLITDYSSISFDAFYRGANVLFYWAEIDDCMFHYGEPTHLMLTEQMAFGEVCSEDSRLPELIVRSYESTQSQEHVQRFRQLVTYHDGQNTKRLVDRLYTDFREFD